MELGGRECEVGWWWWLAKAGTVKIYLPPSPALRFTSSQNFLWHSPHFTLTWVIPRLIPFDMGKTQGMRNVLFEKDELNVLHYGPSSLENGELH